MQLFLPLLWFFQGWCECHLLFSDIIADNRDHPQPLKAAIKQSKKDINLYLGATNGMFCAVKASLPCLAIRPEQANYPPFLLKCRCPLTCQRALATF